MNTPDRRLGDALDRLYRNFNLPESAADPIHIVRRYRAAADREVAGFCAAALAFGRVASVIDTVERLLARLGPSPAVSVRRFEPGREGQALEAIGHRWIRGRDMSALLWVLRRMLESSGSIEQFFLAGYDPAAADVGTALESFCTRALAVDLRPVYGRIPARPGVQYFFPRPSGGSACKRLNLYLRWMVRRDALDLGVWTGVSPAQLIVPLDTHVIRAGRALGLTALRSPGWRMAVDITAALRRFDAADPVRFDFSLCHVGMDRGCGFDGSCHDDECPLRGFCGTAAATTAAARGAARKRRASRRPSARR